MNEPMKNRREFLATVGAAGAASNLAGPAGTRGTFAAEGKEKLAIEGGTPVRKSPHALVIGWDLRTGEEKKRILVPKLRSPEHHHRCYRNKATGRFMISSYEGAEFLDFEGNEHSQNNWIRGVCKNGMMPCNGMLYVPPDQCFCYPGVRLVGFNALSADPGDRQGSAAERLERGPAYGQIGDRRSEIGNPAHLSFYETI